MDRMFVDRRIAFFLALLFPIQESSDRRDNCALICARLQGRRSATNGNGQDDFTCAPFWMRYGPDISLDGLGRSDKTGTISVALDKTRAVRDRHEIQRAADDIRANLKTFGLVSFLKRAN